MAKSRGVDGSGLKERNRDNIIKSRGEKIAEWLAIPKNAIITFLCLLTACYCFQFFAPFIMLGAYFLKGWCLKQPERAPLKIPEQDGLIDSNEINPGNGKPSKAKGIFFLGVERNSSAKEIWLTNDDTRQHFLILGTTGAGKAIRSSALVHTETGWKVAGSVTVGEMISTPFGETARVTGVFPQGKRRIWKVAFEDGRVAEVDGEHLWEIHHKNRNLKSQVLTTRELYDLKRDGSIFSVVVSDPPEKPEQDFPLSPYTLGEFLASYKGPYIALEDAEVIKPLGLSGITYDTKFIPEIYLEGSIKQRWELLQGLMDTDGIYENDVLSFSSSSEKLAQGVQKLAWSLGGIAHISSCIRDNKTLHIVQMKLKTPQKAFWLSENKGLVSKRYHSKNLKLDIVSIEMTEVEDDCVCFMVDHPRHLFVMEDYISTHNTELLLAFAANAISWGSGLIFVDGKGDIKLMATMYTLAKRWNREADFLVLNFMPPDGNIAPGEVISNTHNPYTFGEADDLIQQINGLMPEGGGDGMWKDRAMTMITAVVMILVWMRNQGLIDLSVGVLKKYVQFANIISLLEIPNLPADLKGNLMDYLSSLGNFELEKGAKQGEDVIKQHGFLEMQFSGPFSSLSNTYGHVFNTNHGEVDMFDVVLNRRILVTMLPSLSKSPADVERMGKIIVASLKNMMGATLGNVGKSYGAKWLDTVELRVTTSPSPCLVILDEVGYYTVNGMAMMAAQVRSLGFSMIYASQDLKAMTRLNPEEAQSIMANTNTKIIMRTEDGETMEMAQKSGGRGYKMTGRSYDHKPGDFGYEWKESDHLQMELEDRINTLDLKSQNSGELTLLYKDIIIRGKAFYVDSPNLYSNIQAVETPINQFVAIEKPDIESVKNNQIVPLITKNLMDPDCSTRLKEKADNLRQTASADDEIAIVSGFLERIKRANLSKRMEIHETVSAITELARHTANDASIYSNTVANARRRPTDSLPPDVEIPLTEVDVKRIVNTQTISVDDKNPQPAVDVDDMVHDEVTLSALQALNKTPESNKEEEIKKVRSAIDTKLAEATHEGSASDALIEIETAKESSRKITEEINNDVQINIPEEDEFSEVPGEIENNEGDITDIDPEDLFGSVEDKKAPEVKKPEPKPVAPVVVSPKAPEKVEDVKTDDKKTGSDTSNLGGSEEGSGDDNTFDLEGFMSVVFNNGEEE